MPIEIIAAVIVIGAIAAIAILIKWFIEFAERQEIDDMYFDFLLVLESDYKHRLNGNNRFIVNPDVIQDMYPEKRKVVVLGVFKKLTEHKIIDRDPIDQAWCLR